ncbi:hypothetical protein [Consotaella salsifontis]|uniref:Uncharacterized protein n=1 Tax=Consotaella salsifontis TaxID=1365950 RepID=A0A1T4SRW2_9HYPH|nr:hypothetical protein [Consotaella salsifontis]SKA30903.1 hypothetical protein SAMN05428963_11384 [Consotaella salsifontis]
MSDWIRWGGGPMPVDRSERVEVETECHATFTAFAGALEWSFYNGHDGVIAYRVVTD